MVKYANKLHKKSMQSSLPFDSFRHVAADMQRICEGTCYTCYIVLVHVILHWYMLHGTGTFYMILIHGTCSLGGGCHLKE